MIWIYMLPYTLFTGFFGAIGSLIAIIILAMGVLRCSFLLVLLITQDFARFKAEQTEGLSLVREKIKNGTDKIKSFFNEASK